MSEGLPTLEGERVRLRPFTAADATDVFVYSADPEVTRYLMWHPHRTLDDARDFTQRKAHQNLEQERIWAMVWKPTGQVIGSTGFTRLEPTNATGEIGTAMHRAFWGSGANHEAKQLVITYGFTVLGLRRIEMHTDARNLRSQRSIEKLGFTREGVLRRYPVVKGETRDTVVYGLLAEEWQLTYPLPGPGR